MNDRRAVEAFAYYNKPSVDSVIWKDNVIADAVEIVVENKVDAIKNEGHGDQ